jgi:hypothetical protein
MNSKQIEAQFSAMGARFRTRIVPENRFGAEAARLTS